MNTVQVYPLFTDPKKSFHGCLNFRAVFDIEHTGHGYPAAINEFLHHATLDPGMYLILDTGVDEMDAAKGMVFTIDKDGAFHQGVPETAPIMTRWPPK